MRKSFALCEAFGLTPFRAKPPEAQPRGPLRREAAADTAVSGGEALRSPALRAARRKCRYGRLRAGRISRWRGAFGPPPPSRPHLSPG